MTTATSAIEVELVFYQGQVEHWLRFGNAMDERVLDRRRRGVLFAPGAVFGFVRWHGGEYGTISSRLDVLRACDPGEAVSTVPGVTPGGDILLRLDGWPKVKRALDAIAAIEALGIDPADTAPEWWRHLHNRVTCNEPHRLYTRAQHRAWLLRQKAGG